MLPFGVTAFSSRCENLLLQYQRALIEYTFPCLPVFVQLPVLHCTSQPFYRTMGGTLEWTVSRHLTLCRWQFSLSGLWCCPLPQSCVTIGALCRKILGAKVICLSHWHAVILNGRLYVCLRARWAIHPDALVTKEAVNTGAQLFDCLIVSNSPGSIN